MRHIMVCATPRVGATVLCESLRGIPELRGLREHPDAEPVDSVLAEMVHWAQMPVPMPEVYRESFVYLYRRDQMAQAVSWAYSAACGRYHSTQPEAAEPTIEAEDVTNAYARIVSDDVEWRDWLPDTAILFAYEDMQHDVPAAARYIAKRLGFDGEPAAPTLRPFGSKAKQALREDLR